eukprot:TRINITY_DN38319_c0_g1_i1.p1 TRINITY_DN38319_c0_g1~~TRINITY_DN38319_c0_g1_i1.p1  ORF type:complete len:1278 (-),score=174.59 TRINITY_DN38319_c0_g1_i1:181-4014(-)
MEVLAALGLGAKELFSYNRENFKFDQDQRIERESLRLEMQVKRFELFREDVRDLVELTVDRMDVYHLVGALFLEFCIVLFCEGRVQASAPPFLLSMFLLSNACAFIYLLLAVWLSMHASIASHSFGVRLLTRFVRLPIPSMKQITMLRSQLKDYERQNVSNLLRLPFVDQKTQEWDNTLHLEKDGTSSKKQHSTAGVESDGIGAALGIGVTDRGKRPSAVFAQRAQSPSCSRDTQAGRKQRPKADYLSVPSVAVSSDPGVSAGAASSSSRAVGPPSAAKLGRSSTPSPEPSFDRGAVPSPPPEARKGDDEGDNLLAEDAESPFGGTDLLESKMGAQPERHVQLFRQLQSKWQCYDAYCRVCMGLGVNQILQGLSYYAICHTLVENHSPTTGYALVVMFQSTTIALAVLDLAGLKRREILAVQVVGVMPCLITAFGVANGKRDALGTLDPDENYNLSPLSFMFQVLWLELWLRVAAPSDDQAKLPRRFRQVLFLDVFGDANGWDPSQADDDEQDGLLDNMLNKSFGEMDRHAGQDEYANVGELDHVIEQAASQLTLAQCAVRRWASVPAWAFSKEQTREFGRLREQFNSWGNTINGELRRDALLRRQPEMTNIFEDPLRLHNDIDPAERAMDPFAKCLVGPFEHDGGFQAMCYHYDLDKQQTIFEDSCAKEAPGALVLTLQAVTSIVEDLEKDARFLLESRIMSDLSLETRRRHHAARAKAEKRKSGQDQRRRAQARVRSMVGMSSETSDAPTPEPLRAKISHPVATAIESFPNLVKLFSRRRAGHERLNDESGVELLSQTDGPPIPANSEGSSSRLDSIEPLDSTDVSPPETRRSSARTSQHRQHRDPTLVAMAGEHAQHFVPERLPWQVLSRMTRVLQLCWAYTGLMALLKEIHLYQVDFQEHPGSERRLRAETALEFERLGVEWPHGTLFRPRGLACMSGGVDSVSIGDLGGAVSGLAVTSPFAMYSVDTRGQQATATRETRSAAPAAKHSGSIFQLEEIHRERLPPSTVLICPPQTPRADSDISFGDPGGHELNASISALRAASTPTSFSNSSLASSCLLAAPTSKGLEVWPADSQGRNSESASLLLIDGNPWKLLAGAVVRCSGATWLLPVDKEYVRPTWCLMLVGWDGELLPVAAVPLFDGLGHPPRTRTRVSPLFDAPLHATVLDGEVMTLHLEPRRGRLWAVVRHVQGVSSGVELEAWDLLGSQSLGRKRVLWPPGIGVFRPAALCEDEVLGMLAIGRSDVTGPSLLRAALPAELDIVNDETETAFLATT